MPRYRIMEAPIRILYLKNTSKEKIMELEKIIEQANKELSLMDSWVEQLIDLAK